MEKSTVRIHPPPPLAFPQTVLMVGVAKNAFAFQIS